MKTSQRTTIERDLQTLFREGAAGGLSDAELLLRFVDRRDPAAFESLVQRHGAMVLGVCRRILRDSHDAEDAFQATFLVLARKAGSVVPRTMLAGWLYTESLAGRRSRRGRPFGDGGPRSDRWGSCPIGRRPGPGACTTTSGRSSIGSWTGSRHRYQAPILLCDVQGMSQARGRRGARLDPGHGLRPSGAGSGDHATRLARRGVGLAGAALAVAWHARAGGGRPLRKARVDHGRGCRPALRREGGFAEIDLARGFHAHGRSDSRHDEGHAHENLVRDDIGRGLADHRGRGGVPHEFATRRRLRRPARGCGPPAAEQHEGPRRLARPDRRSRSNEPTARQIALRDTQDETKARLRGTWKMIGQVCRRQGEPRRAGPVLAIRWQLGRDRVEARGERCPRVTS